MVNPLDYIMSQQSRRDEQIRNLVNTFLAMKEHKYRQGQQEIENQRETERASREERRLKLAEDAASKQEIKEPYVPKEVQDAQYYAQVMGGQPIDYSQFLPDVKGKKKTAEDLSTYEAKKKIDKRYAPPPKSEPTTIVQKINDTEHRMNQAEQKWLKTWKGQAGQLMPGLEEKKAILQDIKATIMDFGEKGLTPEHIKRLNGLYRINY